VVVAPNILSFTELIGEGVLCALCERSKRNITEREAGITVTI